jgi:hypothetical protein
MNKEARVREAMRLASLLAMARMRRFAQGKGLAAMTPKHVAERNAVKAREALQAFLEKEMS